MSMDESMDEKDEALIDLLDAHARLTRPWPDEPVYLDQPPIPSPPPHPAGLAQGRREEEEELGDRMAGDRWE